MARGQRTEFFRDPGEIRLRQPKLRQRVRYMRVKPRRDDQQFRRESIQSGQQQILPHRAERHAIGARRQRCVEDIAHTPFLRRTGAGIERPLMR